MSFAGKTPVIVVVVCLMMASFVSSAKVSRHPARKHPYLPARPPIDGLHIGMSGDSVFSILHSIALRTNTMHVDSLVLVESDSVRVFGEPAYVRVELLYNKVRTIVINFHPLAGDHYLNARDQAQKYLERYFGVGVISKDQSVVYRRWENEDGTMEASFSDKYYRVFIRLGKRDW